MSEERVSVCRESLERQCGADTVGETVCRLVYQTQCNTRYKPMLIRSISFQDLTMTTQLL